MQIDAGVWMYECTCRCTYNVSWNLDDSSIICLPLMTYYCTIQYNLLYHASCILDIHVLCLLLFGRKKHVVFLRNELSIQQLLFNGKLTMVWCVVIDHAGCIWHYDIQIECFFFTLERWNLRMTKMIPHQQYSNTHGSDDLLHQKLTIFQH